MLHNILFRLQSEVQCTAMCLSSWLLWRIATYIDSRSIFVFTKSWGIAMDQFPQLMVDRTQTRMSRALAWGDRKLETLIAHYSISVAWLLELVASEDFTKRLAVTWFWSTAFGFDHHSWGGCFSHSTAWICNKYLNFNWHPSGARCLFGEVAGGSLVLWGGSWTITISSKIGAS